MVRDPVQKFVSRYHYNRLVNIYPKLAKSKSPVIKYGLLSENVSNVGINQDSNKQYHNQFQFKLNYLFYRNGCTKILKNV